MTQETYAEIVDRVRGILLTAEGRKKIHQRRSAADKMAQGLQELKASGWILNAKRRQVGSHQAVFTVSQGPLQGAAKGLVVSVEFRGVGAGKLLPPPSGHKYPILQTIEDEVRELEWGGSEARVYIRSRANIKPMCEREIQGVIVRDMSLRSKHELLQNLRPVRPAKCMMEIPTAVTEPGKIGTGNIDILARTRTGRSTTYVVCEVKVDKTTPYDAMVQAIQYAAALNVEVNGITGEIKPADRSVYRALFGSRSTAQDPMCFGAMAIIPNGKDVKAQALRTRDELGTRSAWLDVMLFDKNEDGEFRPVFRVKNES
jgi:hypothetical protein